MWRGSTEEIRHYEIPLGLCAEHHSIIPKILLGVTITQEQVKMIKIRDLIEKLIKLMSTVS